MGRDRQRYRDREVAEHRDVWTEERDQEIQKRYRNRKRDRDRVSAKSMGPLRIAKQDGNPYAMLLSLLKLSPVCFR